MNFGAPFAICPQYDGIMALQATYCSRHEIKEKKKKSESKKNFQKHNNTDMKPISQKNIGNSKMTNHLFIASCCVEAKCEMQKVWNGNISSVYGIFVWCTQHSLQYI